jgi:protein O-mannosyl-transferase
MRPSTHAGADAGRDVRATSRTFSERAAQDSSFFQPPALIAGIVLFVIAALPFFPALRGDFLWDDDAHVTANPTVVGPEGLSEIWTTPAANYFPLVLTTFRAIHAIAGLNSTAYHVATLLFHATAAVLLWQVLVGLIEIGPRLRSRPITARNGVRALPQSVFAPAWLGAAFWAVHPVQAESVSWISELKNTESAVFYFAAILCWLRCLDAGMGHQSRSRAGAYVLALLFGLLALLSKPSTVMLPVVLALCAWWVKGKAGTPLPASLATIRRDPAWNGASALTWARYAFALVPFLALSLLAGGWAIWEQKYHQHALGAEWSQSFPEQLEIAGRAIWFYLGKLIWPHPLIFVYPRWALAGVGLMPILPLLAAALVLAGLWWMRATRAKAALFAFAYFLVLLFPVLGFFTVYYFRYSYVADHFQYLASVGPLALGAIGVVYVAERLGRSPWIKALISTTLIGVLSLLTWQQARNYRDGRTLYTAVLAENSSCWLAHNNLARLLTEHGEIDAAIEHCRTSLQLHASPVGHFNLAVALAEKGEADPAVAEYRAAIMLDPTLVEAYDNLGVLLATLGRPDEAIDQYRRALAVDPTSATAHINWGLLLAAAGDFHGAIEHYQRAITADARLPDPYDYLGVAFVRLRRYDDALAAFRQALIVDPRYAPAGHHILQVEQLTGK